MPMPLLPEPQLPQDIQDHYLQIAEMVLGAELVHARRRSLCARAGEEELFGDRAGAGPAGMRVADPAEVWGQIALIRCHAKS
jgi:hypothetical protein